MSKGGKKGKKGLDPANGIIEGIQSIHGWMSAQTRITPKKPEKKKVVEVESEEVKNQIYSLHIMANTFYRRMISMFLSNSLQETHKS